MQTHIGKWGASCAVRLPKMVVQTLGLAAGQTVDIAIEDGKLILKKAPSRYTLKALIAQMDKCTQPAMELDDTPIGEEYGSKNSTT